MRFLFALVALVFTQPALALDPCDAAAKAQYASVAGYYKTGLLFKIEKCGIAPSYLFGTFHSDDPKYNELLIRVAKAVGKPSAGYFEIPVDAETNAKAASAMALPQAVSLKAMVGELVFTQAAKALAPKGLAPEVLDHLTPWAVAVLLQMPPTLADGKVIDEKLQAFFLNSKKPIYGLESLDAHFGVFTNLPKEKQILLLRESVEDLTQNDASNIALDNAYAAGDLTTIDKLGDQAFAEIGDAQLRDYLEVKLLKERNTAMAAKLATLLPQGNLFIAVGALHLPDAGGLIQLLEAQGYFITPLQP